MSKMNSVDSAVMSVGPTFGAQVLILLLMECCVGGCSKSDVDVSDPARSSTIKVESVMSQSPVRYPGATSLKLYNVPPYECPPEDEEEAEYNDVTRELRRTTPASEFFCTVTDPSPISGAEWARITIDAERVLQNYIKSMNIARTDELGHEVWCDMDTFIIASGSSRGCLEPADRTLLIPLTDSVLYSPAFIREIQENILKKHPLWRFIVYVDAFGYEDEHLVPLAIYPDAVMVGERQVDPAKRDDEVRRWQEDTRLVFDHTRGATIRQLRYIVQRLPSLIPRLPDEKVVLALAADNWRGEHDHSIIWVLQSVEQDVLLPILPDDGACGGDYRVSNGRLSRCWRMGQSYLHAYTLPQGSEYRLTFRYHKEKAGDAELLPGIADQAEFEICAMPDEILTDEQLKSDPRLQVPLDIEFRPRRQ